MSRGRWLRDGDPFVWLAAGALATSVLMLAALLVLIFTRALGFFWPAAVLHVRLVNGSEAMGQVRARELGPAGAERGRVRRVQLQVGNRDVYGADFRWIPEAEIAASSWPREAVVIERVQWGNLYGFVEELREGTTVLAEGPERAWEELQARLPQVQELVKRAVADEGSALGEIDYETQKVRLARKRLERAGETDRAAELDRRLAELDRRYAELLRRLESVRRATQAQRAVVRLAGGARKEVPLAVIVRAYRPNAMSAGEKVALYVAKWWEFVSGEPRESNTQGGVFPALFGTVVMVLVMSFATVPLGVLAALYLREYAREGFAVRAVRVAVNNLAGIPSIVFGVFGLGFFVYTLGGKIDTLFFPDRLPAPTFGTGGILWASVTLALLTVPVVIVATEEALVAVPKENREGSLALGATRAQTVWRVVLPHAMPGVLTGTILAMARAAGEVAPLMLTGVVKMAPDLPLDRHWPFLHLERKFMHLGFHIYDLGFQSPNVEAAKPMVYATALLLVGLVVALNLAAIAVRARLRRRLVGGAF